MDEYVLTPWDLGKRLVDGTDLGCKPRDELGAVPATDVQLLDNRPEQSAAAPYLGLRIDVPLGVDANRQNGPAVLCRSERDWRKLRSFPHPNRAAAAALTAAGLPPTQAVLVRVADVTADGTSVTVGDATIGVEPGAAARLATLLLWRLAEGAATEDPLLVTSGGHPLQPRGITDALGDVVRATGMLLDSCAGSRQSRAAKMYDQGYAISRLGQPLAIPHANAGSIPVADASQGDESSPTPAALLDTKRLRTRRLELAVSRRELARRTGVSLTVIRGLEEGVNHAHIAFGAVAVVAGALGLSLDELTGHARPSSGSATPEDDNEDTPMLGAVLHAAGRLTPATVVADSLGWPAARLRLATGELAGRAASVGLRLIDRDGLLGLVASEAAPASSRRAVTRARFATSGMKATIAQVLHRAVRAELSGAALKLVSNPDQVAAAQLVNAELLDTSLRVGDEVKEALEWAM